MNVLVVSARTLIAQAVQLVLVHQLPHAHISRFDEDIDDNVDHFNAVIFDLERPGRTPMALENLCERLGAHCRRIGIFDRFTPDQAQLAFQLGLTSLVSLDSDERRLSSTVIGGEQRDNSVTATEGLTRNQLDRLRSLSPRELQVLNHLARGMRPADVAQSLGISLHTIATHKRRAFRKLGVQQQSHALQLLLEAGLADPSSGVD